MTELPDDVRVLFDGHYAHVATLLPKESRRGVPVWDGLDDERIAFLTGPDSRKARNIAHAARVAICITDHDQPFTMAEAGGRVTERLEDAAAFAVIDR